MIYTLEIQTEKHTDFIDITLDINKLINKENIKEGICFIYTPHTTAGIFINENSDPDVRNDIEYVLEKIFPWRDPNYRHIEGNSSAHLKSILIGNQKFVFIEDSKLKLGTWESIFFAEFDGPRKRRIYVKIINHK